MVVGQFFHRHAPDVSNSVFDRGIIFPVAVIVTRAKSTPAMKGMTLGHLDDVRRGIHPDDGGGTESGHRFRQEASPASYVENSFAVQ